ncbi:MAG: molybdopterin-synthase adenylyltransferase MoeB [Natronospirillum sp.]
MLSDNQLLRYSRQIFLPDIDIVGQEALQNSRVLVLGLGGLGSPVALYLAAAGVGHLVLSDPDEVDLSNLQRQIVHRTEAIGRPKVESAKQTIQALNPDVIVTALHGVLNDEEMLVEVQKADVVLAGTDNFASRQAANRACWQAGVPLVSAAAIAWEGQISVFDPRRADSPCLHCLYPVTNDTALNCADTGVVAPLVGVIGTSMAMEAMKLIVGVGEPLVGRVQLYDAKQGSWQTLRLRPDPQCPVCSARPR